MPARLTRTIHVFLCMVTSASFASAATKPAPKAGSLITWITQIVPLVIVGAGWSQPIIFQNVEKTTPSVGTLSFYTKDGNPWSG